LPSTGIPLENLMIGRGKKFWKKVNAKIFTSDTMQLLLHENTYYLLSNWDAILVLMEQLSKYCMVRANYEVMQVPSRAKNKNIV